MKVDTLEAYNVPPDIIDVWRNHVGSDLLPVQERAVKEFGLFGTDNLIVFSPTSSGKTFIGEMAAVKAARQNTKVFYLVPQTRVSPFQATFRRLRVGAILARRRRRGDGDVGARAARSRKLSRLLAGSRTSSGSNVRWAHRSTSAKARPFLCEYHGRIGGLAWSVFHACCANQRMSEVYT
jgi:hypothetical protein